MTKVSLAPRGKHDTLRAEMAATVTRLKERSREWMTHPRETFGYPTGLSELDKLTGGCVEEEIITIAGGTGDGKTALLTQAMEYTALQLSRGGLPFATEKTIAFFFSLEMSRHAVYHRSAARLAGVDANQVRRGAVSSQEYARYTQALDTLLHLPLVVCDTPGLTSHDALDYIHLLQDEGFKLAVVGVDYVQLFADEGEGNAKFRVVMRNAISIKNEASCSVVLLSQYSRRKEWESTNSKGEKLDRPPRLSDLYESGILEQSSDQVWMLHNPLVSSDYAWTGPTTVRKELYVRKNRNGKLGRVDLWYTPSLTQFNDADTVGDWVHHHLMREAASHGVVSHAS